MYYYVYMLKRILLQANPMHTSMAEDQYRWTNNFGENELATVPHSTVPNGQADAVNFVFFPKEAM